MTTLASQPTTPPITSHRMIPIALSFVCASCARSVHAGMPRAPVGVQLVVKRLQAAAEHVGGAPLVALEMTERGENERALHFLERRSNAHADSVGVRARAFGAAQRGHFLVAEI